jgi:hypothetical protein
MTTRPGGGETIADMSTDDVLLGAFYPPFASLAVGLILLGAG